MLLISRNIYLFAVAFLNAIISRGFLTAGDITCKDERNIPVDWFVAYKLPTLRSQSSDGTLLAYVDSSMNHGWRLLKTGIKQNSNPLGRTLKSIYTRKGQGSMYAMYNDQISSATDDRHYYPDEMGHTKGFIHFDQQSGYWVVHSVPQFPSNNRSYDYPSSGLQLGQTILCMSLSYDFLDTIGKLFLYNNPQFYDSFVPQKFKDENPNLTAALEGKSLKNKDLSVHNLTSLEGQRFVAFAKSAAYDDDLWTGIAATLKTDLCVESWRKGNPNLNSSCNSEYKVENILQSKLIEYSFNSTQDHAKWAVSKKVQAWERNGEVTIYRQNNSTIWSCIGDINRQVSQKTRGGGAVCMDHPKVALNFQCVVKKLESCAKGRL